MNKLKRSIIYNYMFVSTVLVISSVYLWWLYQVIMPSSSIFDIAFFNGFFIEVTVWIIQILLFSVCAYWFYSKVSKEIEEEKNNRVKEQNQLFANIAHDLKNPMTSLVGLSRALEEGVIAEDQQKHIHHTIAEKAQHMDNIINVMFHYAKMDTLTYDLHKTEVDVVRLVKEFAAQRYHEFEAKEMDLEVQVPEYPVLSYIDRLEFARVIDNLITNSIRHNPNGTKVQIGVEEDQRKIKVWIADTGTVIPKEVQDSIFQPFVSGDESRSTQGGSGLGLAITKKIVEKHNGEILIDETIEGYTKAFVIKLDNPKINSF